MKVSITVEVYSARVVLVTSFEEYKKIHKHANPQSHFCTAEYGSHMYVLVSNMWGSLLDYRFIQCLSHELNHCAMSILGAAGVEFGYNNQEPLCYLQDFLMKKVYKSIQTYENNKIGT